MQVVTLGDVQPRPTIERSRELVRMESGIVMNIAEGENALSLELKSP